MASVASVDAGQYGSTSAFKPECPSLQEKKKLSMHKQLAVVELREEPVSTSGS
jgi:hypothetical protein